MHIIYLFDALDLRQICRAIEPLLNDLNSDIASEWVKSWQTFPLTASISSPAIINK